MRDRDGENISVRHEFPRVAAPKRPFPLLVALSRPLSLASLASRPIFQCGALMVALNANPFRVLHRRGMGCLHPVPRLLMTRRTRPIRRSSIGTTATPAF